MEVNFKANFINTATVKKYAKNTNQYINKKATFLELDLTSSKDIEILKKLSFSWNAAFLKSVLKNVEKKLPNWKVYTLTIQNNDFNNIDSEKILGIAQTSKQDSQSINLEYLQVRPEYTHLNSQRKFKQVGSSIIDCLKKIECVTRINVVSILEEVDFYILNGFFYDMDILQESNLFWQRKSRKSDFID